MASFADRLAKLAQLLDVDGNPPSSGGGSSPLDAYLASSGSARNDEFASGPSIDGKWTLVGTTPDTIDVDSTFADSLYLRRNDTGAQLSAYYQNVPSTPFDITAKLRASTFTANYCRGGGIILLPSSPTTGSAGRYCGSVYNGGRQVSAIAYSNLSSYGGETGAAVISLPVGLWLRVTVLSGGTTADFYYSVDGVFWILMASAVSLGFTVANAGIAAAPEGQSTDMESVIDYYRVSA